MYLSSAVKVPVTETSGVPFWGWIILSLSYVEGIYLFIYFSFPCNKIYERCVRKYVWRKYACRSFMTYESTEYLFYQTCYEFRTIAWSCHSSGSLLVASLFLPEDRVWFHIRSHGICDGHRGIRTASYGSIFLYPATVIPPILRTYSFIHSFIHLSPALCILKPNLNLKQCWRISFICNHELDMTVKHAYSTHNTGISQWYYKTSRALILLLLTTVLQLYPSNLGFGMMFLRVMGK